MSLVATLTQSLRTKYKAKTMDKNEVRRSRYGAWRFFQEQTKMQGGILTEEAKAMIARSTGNTVNIPVLNAENVTISNVRSCTIAPDDITSALVTLTFATFSFGFTMAPARHFNNDIGYQQMYDRKLEMYLQKLAETLDSAAVGVLNTNRNIYWPTNITKYYPQVNNALQVGQSQKNDFFNQAQSILAEMDYYGDANVISSTSLGGMIRRFKAQGDGNAVNEDFQFDPYKWWNTNRLLNADNVESTLFLVPDGYVATANRNTPDNIAGSHVGDFKVWGTAQMPIVDLNMGTFYTKDCSDLSALDGGGSRMEHLKRSLLEGFAFDTDICFVTSYNSNMAGNHQPIVKAEISLT